MKNESNQVYFSPHLTLKILFLIKLKLKYNKIVSIRSLKKDGDDWSI